MSRACALLLVIAISACADGGAPAPAAPLVPPGGPLDPAPAEPLACAGRAAPALGADRLLVGLSGSDASAAKPGFDFRYVYVAGGIPDGAGPCSACGDPACTSGGARCDNASGGCAWWGCWQFDGDPPGRYVDAFVARSAAAGLVPMFTYYQLLQAYRQGAPLGEGTPEITVAANDLAFMRRYLADFRFFLQQLGSRAAFVHFEPDLWGYAQHAGADPRALPAKVASANPEDCGAQEESIAGLGRCVVAMVRKHAPNAKVGLHASPWASGHDAASNAQGSLDVAAEGRKVGAFLEACGAALGDFVVADLADRDAGSSGRWLDASDATLPDFEQVFTWSRAVADRLGRPIVWWQLPVGNMALPDVAGAYRDNRLDYFFDHPDRVAESGAVAMAFGAGAAGQTTPETDGGHLALRAAALEARGGLPLCAAP